LISSERPLLVWFLWHLTFLDGCVIEQALILLIGSAILMVRHNRTVLNINIHGAEFSYTPPVLSLLSKHDIMFPLKLHVLLPLLMDSYPSIAYYLLDLSYFHFFVRQIRFTRVNTLQKLPHLLGLKLPFKALFLKGIYWMFRNI
jgi:hypothetical protein